MPLLLVAMPFVPSSKDAASTKGPASSTCKAGLANDLHKDHSVAEPGVAWDCLPAKSMPLAEKFPILVISGSLKRLRSY